MGVPIVFGRMDKYEKTVIIPEDIQYISSSQFYKVHSQNSIELPTNLKKADSYAFQNCTAERIIINGNPAIAGRAFWECNAKQIIINGNPTIKAGAFSNSTVEQIVINGNPVIQNAAFTDCNLEAFYLENSKKYTVDDGVLFNKKKTKLIAYPAHKRVLEYRIPEEVTSIAPYAFYGANYYVIVLYIPRGVQKLSKIQFHCNQMRPDEPEYDRYYECGWEESIDRKVAWISGHVAFYNPELADIFENGIYLGGPIDDLPNTFKRNATYGFLYAMQIGIKEIEQYKDSYFEFIKKNEDWFIEVGNDYSFNLLLQNKLISIDAIARLVDHPYVRNNSEVMSKVLEYKQLLE